MSNSSCSCCSVTKNLDSNIWNEKSYRRSAGIKKTKFEGFFNLKKLFLVFLDFFFCISGHIEKSYWRSAGVKLPDGFLDFCIFLGFLPISRERRRRATRDPLVSVLCKKKTAGVKTTGFSSANQIRAWVTVKKY